MHQKGTQTAPLTITKFDLLPEFYTHIRSLLAESAIPHISQSYENTHKPLSSQIIDLDKPSPQGQNAASRVKARGELAQWLEQRNHNPLVRGSNP